MSWTGSPSAIEHVCAPDAKLGVSEIDDGYRVDVFAADSACPPVLGIDTLVAIWEVVETVEDDEVTISRFEPGNPRTEVLRYVIETDPVLKLTTIDPANGGSTLRVESIEWDGSGLISTRVVKSGTNDTLIEVEEEWEEFEFGRRLIRRTVDPEGTPLTTQWSYAEHEADHTNDDPPIPVLAGMTIGVVHPNGDEVHYEYESGQALPLVTTETRVTAASTPADAVHEIMTEWPDTYVADGSRIRPLSRLETIGGVAVSRTVWAETNPGFEERRCLNPEDAECEAHLATKYLFDTLTDKEERYPLRIQRPDGRVTTYTYDRGTYTSGGSSAPFAWTFDVSTEPNEPGPDTRVTVDELIVGSPDDVAIPGRSTRTITIHDSAWKPLARSVFVFHESEWDTTPLDRTVYEYDDHGHVAMQYHPDGSVTAHTHESCCDEETVTHPDGSSVETKRDRIGRVAHVIRSGADEWEDPETELTHGAQFSLKTSFTYDALGRQTGRTIQRDGGGGPSLTTSTSYPDHETRLDTDEAGLVTTTESAVSSGGTVVTVTRPDGATEITTYHSDGRILSVSGTGVVHRAYVYGAASAGNKRTWTTEYIGTDDPDNPSDRYTTTWYDAVGRVCEVIRPAFGTGEVRTVYEYGTTSIVDTGQIWRVRTLHDETPIGAPTLYEYDDFAEQVRVGLDLDDDLALADPDRYTESQRHYEKVSGNWWMVSTSTVFDSEAAAEPVELVTISRSRLSGNSISGEVARSESVDAYGSVTTSVRSIDPETVTAFELTTYPDGTTTRSAAHNGLLVSSTSRAGVSTEFCYDDLRRRTDVVDPRIGATQTAYHSTTGRVLSVTDTAGIVTAYDYHTTGAGAGRLKSVEADADGLSRFTYFAYTDGDALSPSAPIGLLARTWGHTPQPVEYGYDALGQRTTMRTFRTTPANNADTWHGASWPSSPPDGDLTEWLFDAATGLLTRKEDDDGKGAEYSYTPDGRLSTREWARFKPGSTTERLKATYTYFDSGETATLDLKKIDYNDDTPDVEFTYTQSGLLRTVKDATTAGTADLRTFHYNAALQPVGEDLPDTFFGDDRDLSRQYETGAAGSGVWPGRPTGLRVEPIGGGTDEYATAWHYDATTGRMERITGPGLPSAGTEPGVNYSYLANSEYVEKIELRHDDNVILRTTRGFESGAGARDLIDYVQNDWIYNGSAVEPPISKYDYTNDDLARRTGVEQTGAAFSASQTLSHGYNDRNELTQTDREVSGDLLRRWSYAYDAIGNRWQHLLTDDPEGLDEVIVANGGYQRNSLNQYTNVNELRADSNTTAVSHAHDADGNLVSITAVSGDMDCSGTLTNFDIDVFVDAIIEGPPFTDYYTAYPTCDHLNGDVNGDGYLNNLDIDLFVGLVVGNGNSARTTLTWDAENRLRSFGPTPGSEAGGMTRVEFRYDYMGRRVEKAVFEWEAGSPGSWELLSRTRFVYDGWNLIQELNVPTSGDPTVLRQYSWGLDLSGQNGDSTVGGLHGAGGIGGLLSVYDTNGTTTGENATSDDKSYVFLYDANGNVGQLVEWASAAGGSSGMAWSAGRLAAKYEYDPYGNITGPDADGDGNIAEEAGPYAAVNPFRFSTKFLDAETGLYYYGYRYYSPRLGRWISLDPIGEEGGINLNAFCENDPKSTIDPLGLRPPVRPPVRLPGRHRSPRVGPGQPVGYPPTGPVRLSPGAIPPGRQLLDDFGLKGAVLPRASSSPENNGETRIGPAPKPDEQAPPKKKPEKPCPENSWSGRCLPCVPPVGTVGFITHLTHPHWPFPGAHTHHFVMMQRPPTSGCICFWHKSTVLSTPMAGAVPVSTPAGGGLAP
ncbi:MAG: RHS repeat-associated core domain-containing protein [Phycisphaerales bacterium]|nr:RHS repeat-associated core domain-containing protein [Phycisphaerales bacterium]